MLRAVKRRRQPTAEELEQAAAAARAARVKAGMPAEPDPGFYVEPAKRLKARPKRK